MPAIVAISKVEPAGITSRAAASSPALKEPRRRLPETPTSFAIVTLPIAASPGSYRSADDRAIARQPQNPAK
ncbi:hypothetical protein STHU_10560 [Allostella humosa]|nr:hypothetical protein STHU_10560 [Stella humosa]